MSKSAKVHPTWHFCTGNPNKLREVQQIIGPNVNFCTESIDVPEYQGEPEDICKQKALYAYQLLKKPIIVEDTSLGFHALQNLPGPYIKWFLLKIKPEGLVKLLTAFDDKSATAKSIFGVCDDGVTVHLFHGETQGVIVDPRGPRHFGWDPIFQPNGFNATYAEMDGALKNEISHRRKALEALKKFLVATHE